MKRYINILFIICLSFSAIQAQTFSTEDPEVTLEGFQQNRAENNFLAAQSRDNLSNIQQANVVIIDQIGAGNTSTINTQSQSSLISIFQNGDNNNLFLGVRANRIIESVSQEGTNHNFTDFSNGADIHNLEVVQQGNNQNLIFYGGNSISENMKIQMQGTTQSVVVRNFN